MTSKSSFTTITVTQGTDEVFGTNYYGYSDGTVGVIPAFGSRSPTTVDGNTIEALWVSDAQPEFVVAITDSTLPENFIIAVTPQGGSREMHDSSSTGTNYRSWTFDLSSVPTGWDGTGTRTVIIEYRPQ